MYIKAIHQRVLLYYHIAGIYCEKKYLQNQAILLSEEIFVIFDFNLPDDFHNFDLQQAKQDII